MFSVTVRRFWSGVYGSVELYASFYSHLRVVRMLV